ncbi:hypothetical protein B0H16DRAFT_1629919, partial [Mycena metata]
GRMTATRCACLSGRLLEGDQQGHPPPRQCKQCRSRRVASRRGREPGGGGRHHHHPRAPEIAPFPFPVSQTTSRKKRKEINKWGRQKKKKTKKAQSAEKNQSKEKNARKSATLCARTKDERRKTLDARLPICAPDATTRGQRKCVYARPARKRKRASQTQTR